MIFQFDAHYVAPVADAPVEDAMEVYSARTAPVEYVRTMKTYLSAPLETADDVHHSTQYPTLARVARDYLAIQGSATASEQEATKRVVAALDDALFIDTAV
ncbi:hypothetical protein B0H16DRAFT_1743372 [Mycena metata]|uniref:HAT C-terminal dimerisation domain-containing protein n=1 Tax=Mycena metata TaxID=1033252 RepID=A0AAD7MEQ4_9AGAR|nr:hypothetical protein B0H16DRAFT_1743372 [Mycena metata]